MKMNHWTLSGSGSPLIISDENERHAAEYDRKKRNAKRRRAYVKKKGKPTQ